MQNIGLAWLVLQLTGSPVLLGIATAVQFLPVLLFSIFAGPLVDRFPKKQVLLLTQSCLMVLAVLLFLLAGFRTAQYWQILVLSFALGLVNTLDIPTRQSFIIEMVGRQDLMNAISLNSTVFNLARVVGPAVAGLLIAGLGTATCFLVNALSFLAVIGALLLIEVPGAPFPREANRVNLNEVLASMNEGLHYIASKPRILFPIVLMALLSTFVINYNVVVPLFAQDVLGGDAVHFGLLMTSMGLGSLLAAIVLALRSRRGPQARVLAVSSFLMSLFFTLTGLTDTFFLACAALGLVGFFTVSFSASCNAYIQIQTEDRMRGRVMSVYALVFGGVTPIGSYYAGQVSESFGVKICMVVSGGIGILSSAFIAFQGVKKKKNLDSKQS